MKDNVPSNEKLISEFNEAKFQILRLHNIWAECKYLREKGKIISWRWRLDTATIELWNDAKRLDKDKNKDEDSYIKGLELIDKEVKKAIEDKNPAELYVKLVEKEKLLREIQEKSGKGARYKSVDEDYM